MEIYRAYKLCIKPTEAQAKIDALRGRYTCVQDMIPIFIG